MQDASRQNRPPQGAWGRRALDLFETSLDAIVCIDDRGAVLGLNLAACRLLGWQGDGALGRAATELLAPAQGDAGLADDVGRAVAEPGRAPRRVERTVATRQGETLWVDASIVATEDDEGRRAATVFLRDVTAARRSAQRREVETRLARALVGARSGEELAPSTLELLGTGLEFDHVELWKVDAQRTSLRLTTAWRRHPGSRFADEARALVLGLGDDLAGLGAAGEVVCVDDAQQLDGLVRGAAVLEAGIRGCAALPVHVGATVYEVVVLARSAPEPLDPGLRQTLESVALLLGQFAERSGAERRLSGETVALAAVARATRGLTDATDSDTAAHAICAAAVELCGASHAFVALPHAEDSGLTIRASVPPDLDQAHFAAVAGTMLRAYESERPAFVSDLGAPQATREGAQGAAGLVSGLVQPLLRRDGAALGVLGVGWTTRRATLDNSTRRLVALLADEAASALSRVDLVNRLEAAARTDPLTGLANVRWWSEQLGRELAAAERGERPTAVALIDLDGFKGYNDRMGHPAGDRILRACAAAWQAQLRQGDLLARLGGDEFAVLLPSCDTERAVRLAERLRTATEEITASIGIASWDPGEPVADLMLRADAALYEAKAAGRDRIAAR